MSFDKTSEAESREHQKQERREEEARRRAALAADPRVQAMKEALKDRHALRFAPDRSNGARPAVAPGGTTRSFPPIRWTKI